MYRHSGIALPESSEVGARFSKTMCHHEGAVGLLYLKYQLGQSLNSPVSRSVRRQIVSISGQSLKLR